MDKKELIRQYKQAKTEMGVFAYICLPTKKAYLGIGQNIKADMNSINFQLNLGSYPKSSLQSDWKQHGANNFETKVLETLKYDDDETKTDYTKDLKMLRELIAEQFNNKEMF